MQPSGPLFLDWDCNAPEQLLIAEDIVFLFLYFFACFTYFSLPLLPFITSVKNKLMLKDVMGVEMTIT